MMAAGSRLQGIDISVSIDGAARTIADLVSLLAADISSQEAKRRRL